MTAALLSIFAITGSYSNKSYLTKTYLFNIHLADLKLSALLDTSGFQKRQLATLTTRDDGLASQIISATGATSLISSAESALANGAQSALSDVSNIVSQLEDLQFSDLGLADLYQLSYWGYCRGQTVGDAKTQNELGSVGKDFDNSNINITWCSKPKAGYKIDPLTIFKQELNNSLQEAIRGNNPISTAIQTDISYLVDNLSYKTLNLPGNLNGKIQTFGSLITASFGLLLAGAVLSVISIVIQLLGCFISPQSCFLSFMNFLFECLIFIILLLGSILVTFTCSYTRGQINDNTSKYGIKSFLSINFYAFAWSATVAAWLCLFFNLLGHCCGLFGTGRRRFRSLPPPPPPEEYYEPPEMAYSHYEGGSEKGSYRTHN